MTQLPLAFMKKRHILAVVPPELNDLQTRTLKELRALCQALVTPHSGTRAKVINRIMDVSDLRTKLKDFTHPDQIKATFKGKELRAMCAVARVWKGGNKYSKSASLLNWRNTCRRKGEERIKEAMEEAKRRKGESNNISE